MNRDDMGREREFIDLVVEAVRDVKEGRKPRELGFGSAHSTAVHLGFIEECSQKKPCPTCGTPLHDWTYWRVTLAGDAYLTLAIAIEARRVATTKIGAMRSTKARPSPKHSSRTNPDGE
jgi:hypothetical protein